MQARSRGARPRRRTCARASCLARLLLAVSLSVSILSLATRARGQPPDSTAVVIGQTGVTPASASGAPGLGSTLRVLRESQSPTRPIERLTSLFGLAVLIALSWLLSVNRRAVAWRVVVWGTALQFLFALVVLKTDPGRAFFLLMNDFVITLLGFAEQGARFIFGNLVRNNVPVGSAPAGDPTMGPVLPGQEIGWAATGAYFAFNVLPTIIFFSSLMSVLYYLRIMPLLVRAMAWVMRRTMGTSGAESLSASANIFVGHTEAPLVIRPFVPTMTLSELHAVMVGGFANVAGGVMAAYVGMLATSFPDIAGHLIAASVMSAPTSLAVAKLLLPETEVPETSGKVLRTKVRARDETDSVNLIDAATRGAGDGLRLALNVGAMLLAFVALVAMLNHLFGWAGGLAGVEGLSMQRILGWIFWPIAWLLGVPAGECAIVGRLLGERMVLNEFVAYLDLANMLAQGEALSYRGVTIASYALCGFANFGSIAIAIGGIGAIAEGRRQDLARIGMRAMIGGTISTLMVAAVAGILL